MPRQRRTKGEGSVYQDCANGSWVSKVPYKDPATGRTLYDKKSFPSEAKAKAHRSEFVKLRDRGQLPGAGAAKIDSQLGVELPEEAAKYPSSTFGRVYATLLEHIYKAELKAHSFDCRNYRAKKYLLPQLGHHKLDRLTSLVVQATLTRLQKEGAGATTLLHLRRDLHSFYERIGPDGLGLVDNNPVTKGVKVAAPKPRTKRILQPTAFAKLLADLQEGAGQLPAAIVGLTAVSVCTGLRKAEAMALRREHFDFENNRLQVAGAAARGVGKGKHVSTTKTTAGSRTVPMPPILKRILERLGTDKLEEGFAFSTAKGTMIESSKVTRLFKEVKTLCELPKDMIFHDLRSTFSSLLDGRVGARTIMETLGHTRVSTSQNVYMRALDESKLAVATIIEDLATKKSPGS
jgi:integrase